MSRYLLAAFHFPLFFIADGAELLLDLGVSATIVGT